MIGYLAMGALVLGSVTFFLGAEAGILAAIVAHPVTAIAWYKAFFIGPVWINPVGALAIVTTLAVFVWALAKGPPIHHMPLFGFWCAYIFYYLFASTLHAMNFGAAGSVDLMIRHLAGFTGFYMGQAYFTKHARFRQFLIALIISGIFPVSIIVYQVFSGEGTLREMSEGGELRIEMTAGLQRVSGFYHDIVPVRGYAYQCLAGILLYWSYFLKPDGDKVKKVILLGLGAATLFVLYKMYSKAAIITMMAWFVIWCVGYRRYGLAFVIAAVFLGINLLHSDVILDEAGRLFSHEFAGVASDASTAEQRQLLAGRVGVWEQMLVQFSRASTIEQFFGLWAAKGAHNDYLQKLFSGGVFGLGIYVLLLMRIGWSVGMLNLRERSPINLVAAMVFCGWMVDTLGVVPSVYPAYQWYAWGLIGLAIRGLESEKSQAAPAMRPQLDRPIWQRDAEEVTKPLRTQRFGPHR